MTENFGNQNRKGKNGRHRNYGSNNWGSCNTDILYMSDYKWCHGPTCHEDKTQDRVRGSKGSKVLRTKKVKTTDESEWYCPDDMFNWFCSQTCMHKFIKTNITRVIALAPRNEPLETLINDPVKTEGYYGWKINERGVDTQTEQDIIGL